MLEESGAEFRALVTDVNLGGKVTGWDVEACTRATR
jgi:hypothetical protein